MTIKVNWTSDPAKACPRSAPTLYGWRDYLVVAVLYGVIILTGLFAH